MRALITRPAEDAERIATPLRARGVEIMLEPLLVILPAAGPAPVLDGAQALLFTSANGVRAFRAAVANRTLPVYAVGDATAKVARELGFTQVTSANGDVGALVDLVRSKVAPTAGDLVHVAGSVTAGDLAGSLAEAGFTVRIERLYQTRTAVSLSKEARRALAEGMIDAVFLFSPRTARTFVELLTKAGLTGAMERVTIYALSGAVAEEVKDLPSRAMRVASSPTQDALLSLCDGDLKGGGSVEEQSTDNSGRVVPEGTRKGGSPGMNTPSKDERPADETKDVRLAEEAKEDCPADKVDEAVAEQGETDGSEAELNTGAGQVKGTPWTAASEPKDKTGEHGPEGDEGDAAYGGSTGPAPEQATPATPRKKGGGLTLFVLLLLALAAAAGSYPWWRPLVPEAVRTYLPAIPGAPDSPRMVALEGTVTSLDGRVASVEAAIATLKADLGTGVGTAVTDRIATLEQDLAALKGMAVPEGNGAGRTEAGSIASSPSLGDSDVVLGLREELDNTQETLADLRAQFGDLETAQADLKADQVAPSTVLALSGRLTEIEGIARQANTRRNSSLALLLAVGQLREAAAQGEPFESELLAVLAIAKGAGMDTKGITPLDPLAKTGVSTRAALRFQFDAVARAISRSVLAPEGSGWMDRTLGALTNLVTVRRVDGGDAEGEGTLDLVSRAESMVFQNDLAGAVAVLGKLTGAAAEAAQPWLSAAKAKLTAESALSGLTAEALAAVGAADALAPVDSKTGASTGMEG
ncbi:MAG: uroporphyrinogen-III synthase [Rhodospirillum sp.]|nr:uroporphyrinogen-III synthase [Rhodospirillum sp.]MCF8487664.1 uroporphyrinogen-III synthase [Rhodospirillum sp.]MCF8500409.1 uroporphyrinogen-III synthase [Rhodospirillum sp.]